MLKKSANEIKTALEKRIDVTYLNDARDVVMVASVGAWRAVDLEHAAAEASIKNAIHAIEAVKLNASAREMPEEDVRKVLTGLEVTSATGSSKVYGSSDVDAFLKNRDMALELEAAEAEADVVITRPAGDVKKCSEWFSMFDRSDRNKLAAYIEPYTSRAAFERVKLWNEKQDKEITMDAFEGYLRTFFNGNKKAELKKSARSMMNGILGVKGNIFKALALAGSEVPVEGFNNYAAMYGGKASLLADGSYRFTYNGVKKAAVIRGLATLIAVLLDEGVFHVKEEEAAA